MRTYVKRHKLLTTIIILACLGAGYYGYRALYSEEQSIRYVLATVTRGTITTARSGSGHVSASNQVDVKAKASGDVVVLAVKNGQAVRAGTLLAQLDARDAQKTVRDLAVNLSSAQLGLEKLTQPADELSILQSENSIAQAKESKQKAEDDLQKSYEDGFNAVANAFLDLPNIMAGLYDIELGSALGGSQWNIDYYMNAVQSFNNTIVRYRDAAYRAYQDARIAYDDNFDAYKTANRLSDRVTVKTLIDETYETTKTVAEAQKSATNLIQFYKDKIIERGFKSHTLADTHLTTLNTHTSKTNAHLSSLLSIRRTMITNEEAIVNAERSIAERTASFVKLKAGADALDIQSQKLAITQRTNALADAREKLADYFIRAPFDGVIAEVPVKKGDPVSANTVVATLITTQPIAEISLNELDAAKVKIGAKATLTFDAVPDLGIAGAVTKIDTLGAVAQGVVSYNVEISFGTQDDRVKPGMSVSASIITDTKFDVLMASNAAVKTQGDRSTVDVPDGDVVLDTGKTAGVTLARPPRRVTVAIGIANDDFTEITDGLREGDIVVVGTMNPATNAQRNNTQSSTPAFRIPGLPGGGGGGGGSGQRSGFR